jgi:hypothetical protein
MILPDDFAVTIMDGGELNCKGKSIYSAPAPYISAALTGIVMNVGSKVINCNVVGFANNCIKIQTSSPDNPPMIVDTNVGFCNYGFNGDNAKAITITNSTAVNNNFFGLYFSGDGNLTLSNVTSSNNTVSNMEFVGSVKVDMTNVRACNGGTNDIFNDGATVTVTSSSLTCDQNKVSIKGGGTSITCNNPCS